MSRRLLLLCFIAGALVLAVLLAHTGVGALVSDARRTGWMFAVIFAVYGAVYACNAAAWRIVARNGTRGISFPRAYGLVASGFALNFLTPVLNFGGEPFRAAAAAGAVGPRHAAGSVLIHNVLRGLSLLLGWITALGLALLLLPFEPARFALLAGGMAVACGLAVILLVGHRRNVLRHLLDWCRDVPLLAPLGRRLEQRRETLLEIDAQVSDFSRRTPGHFWQALGLEYASRWALGLEYFLILVSLGQHATYLQALAITGLESLVTTALFFFPYEIGTKEGGLYLLVRWFGIPGQVGIYAALVSRARDLAWIALGLLLVWTGRASQVSAPARAAERA